MDLSLWDRSKYAFEHMLEESEKATERLVERVEGIGSRARARLERARVERHLFRRFAQLGNRVYEVWRTQSPEFDALLWSDPVLRDHLKRLRELDEQLHKAEAQLGNGD